jgi:hypothetical protein
MAEQNWRVRIRMYRKWLGDCFLLSFRNGGSLSHILIDCGALSGTPGGKALVREAVSGIHAATEGKLDAIVLTHEHWDHISGFADALDEFRQFEIGEVWAAWTEDPGQEIAQEAKKKVRNRLQTLQLALRRFSLENSPDGQARGAALAALVAFSENTDAAMESALSLGSDKFLEPGEIVERPWLPGVRVYVLGPPKDVAALHNLMGSGKTDIYGTDAAAAEASFAAAAGAAEVDRYAPFDRYLQWDADQWAKDPRWPKLAASYAAGPERRIDSAWLNAAAELALQLDSYTNNTSLVLAFELTATNEVLLFPGDAQIGNWLSWKNVEFSGGKPTAGDLLSRTVFYKVGHHGSHNATLRTGGLESMRSPALVAAIPVDEEAAHRPKGGCPNGWDMPAGPLLTALQEKTKGRVLRADADLPKNSAALTDAEWQRFSETADFDEHYVEYRLG